MQLKHLTPVIIILVNFAYGGSLRRSEVKTPYSSLQASLNGPSESSIGFGDSFSERLLRRSPAAASIAANDDSLNMISSIEMDFNRRLRQEEYAYTNELKRAGSALLDGRKVANLQGSHLKRVSKLVKAAEKTFSGTLSRKNLSPDEEDIYKKRFAAALEQIQLRSEGRNLITRSNIQLRELDRRYTGSELTNKKNAAYDSALLDYGRLLVESSQERTFIAAELMEVMAKMNWSHDSTSKGEGKAKSEEAFGERT